jgi:TP901 family phage tail tape measure protein
VDINLGTIAATVRLDLSQLSTDAGSAEKIIVNVTQNIKQQLGSVQQSAAQMAAQTRQALNTLSNTFLGIGGGITAALGSAVAASEKYERTLRNVSANTGQTEAETAQMRKTIEELGSRSAAPLEKIADGYQHVSNFGFKGADATKVLSVALKSAIATGSDAGKTAELLAGVLHTFNLTADHSAEVMTQMRQAAAAANATLDQFTSGSGKALAEANSFGLGIGQVNSFITLLTQNLYTVPRAATQYTGLVNAISKPTPAVIKLLEGLGTVAGIKLADDFTLSGLRAKGWIGIIEDIKKVADAKGVDPAGLLQNLIGGQRGGAGARIVLSHLQQAKDLIRQQEDAARHATATTWQYSKANESLSGQVQIVKNNMVILSGEVEKALLPALRALMASVRDGLKWFQQLSPEVKENTVRIAAIAGAAALAIGGITRIISAIVALRAALTALSATSAATWLSMLGPIALVVAAVGGLIYLIHRAMSDMNAAIQEGRQAAWERGQERLRTDPTATEMLIEDRRKANELHRKKIRDLQTGAATTWSAAAPFGSTVAAEQDAIRSNERVIKDLQEKVNRMRREAVQQPIGALVAGAAGLGGEFTPKSGGKQFNAKDFLPKKGGGKAAGDAEREADRLKQERLDAEESYRDKLYQILHSEEEIEVNNANKEAQALVERGVNSKKVLQLLGLQIGQIRKSYQERRDEAEREHEAERARIETEGDQRQEAIRDEIAKMDLGEFDRRRLEVQREFEKALRENPADEALLGDKWKAQMNEIARDQKAAIDQMMPDFQRLSAAISEATNKSMLEWRKRMEEIRQEAAKVWKEEQQRIDERDRFELDTGRINLQQYKERLQRKLAGLQEYSVEWMRLMRELYQIEQQQNQETQRKEEERNKQRAEGIRKFTDPAQSILANAFEGLFEHGPKKFFQAVLDGFKQMIARMVAEILAKAAIFGLLDLFTGGGASGILGPFGKFLGFDDAHNDRLARHWGFDFGHHFLNGIADYQQQRLAPAGLSSAGGGVGGGNYAPTVNINFHGTTIHRDVDVERLGERLAYITAERLRGTRFGTGR